MKICNFVVDLCDFRVLCVLFCVILVGFEVIQPIPGGFALLYYWSDLNITVNSNQIQNQITNRYYPFIVNTNQSYIKKCRNKGNEVF
jgi:hypothetical protein